MLVLVRSKHVGMPRELELSNGLVGGEARVPLTLGGRGRLGEQLDLQRRTTVAPSAERDVIACR
eukprot:NODE_1793_length_758_cov_11.880113_g1501_i0.p6 GENE.NODE_1793_length_758_cov_11.880113_g1501_i0~~NODE_1793_length_758_cov_11.880113_g1501_i0.p6  ORF type:complete len:64 (-),score=4.87 NODE_1793_length_758_cov_11.880113_g1501_i0:486-677(-)